jgi:hypothetical protein
MSQTSSAPIAQPPAETLVRDIRRAIRKHHSAAGKICVVLEGQRGEESLAALCRREAIMVGKPAPGSNGGNAPPGFALGCDCRVIGFANPATFPPQQPEDCRGFQPGC